jgi:Flp pilus assembly protein TadG
VVGLFMLTLIFLTVEIVYAMVARGVVEAGLERASRLASTGAPLPNPTMAQRRATFDSTYQSLVSGMINYPAAITNTVTSYKRVQWATSTPTQAELDAEFGWTGGPAPRPTIADVIHNDFGATKWFVVYESSYQHQMLSGTLFCNMIPVSGCTGRLRMDIRIMRQNEPF